MDSFTNCSLPGKSTKMQKNEEICNLLVYGYASKLYKDEERAYELDQGKHLIPWMGDESLKIDRYDVRGYLNDLSSFEEINYKDEVGLGLSEEDRIMEQMCDIERYHALISNEEEEEGYKEEEIKRQNQSLTKEYHQVPFQYPDPSSNLKTDSFEGGESTEHLDKPFSPNPHSCFPPDMILPQTDKVNEIIKKTAEYVAKHGRQMEIMIKARQQNSDKFSFLNRNSELNSYYEYILNELKNKCYKKNNIVGDNKTNFNEPLGIFTFSKSVESAPQVSMPDDDSMSEAMQNCPYSMIVHRIQNSNSNQTNDFMSVQEQNPGTSKTEKSETHGQRF